MPKCEKFVKAYEACAERDQRATRRGRGRTDGAMRRDASANAWAWGMCEGRFERAGDHD